MTKQKRADMLLVLVTAFWGVSYLMLDICLEDIPPFNLNAIRFISAFALLGVIFAGRIKNPSAQTLKYSFYIGLCLTATYICVTFGIKYTSVSNAGFICALPVLFTPLFLFVFYGKKPGAKLFISLLLCAVGMALLTLNEKFVPAKGDIICLGCAVFYSFDLIITEKAVSRPDVDPFALGIYQLLTVGVLMLILSFIFEKPHLPTTTKTWIYSLFLGIFCSGVCFLVQTTAQKWTTASRVGLIFTLEPVFSAFAAYFFAGEKLSLRGYAGAAVMLISLLICETDIGRFFHKHGKEA
ncbi:MAG: DMT family transporter [Clostridia bacterium]|nr:DMT family transporter [Clostridia bacterium]